MDADSAYAWLALNPRPIIEGDEGPEEYDKRLDVWLFKFSVAHEAIHDEKHDRIGFAQN